jgi:hypothetical protein
MPAKSKKQQRFMGMVHAYQKGELDDAPESVKKAASSMTKKAAKDFAETKHKGLPEKKVKEDINIVEDLKSLTFKEYLEIDEGLLDFAKGAGSEIGRKVAGSAPVRAAKDVIAAGHAASAEATKKQAVQAALNAQKLLAQMGPDGEQMLMQAFQAMGQQGQLGAKLYQQVKARTGQQKQAAPAQRAAPAQQQAVPSSAVPAAFRTPANKPVAMRTKSGQTLALANFDFTIDGKDYLQEAVGDFLGGMARAAKQKVAGAINQYAERNPLRGLGDIWQAGKAASKAGDVKKKIQAIAQQLAQLATALYKQQAAPAQAGA